MRTNFKILLLIVCCALLAFGITRIVVGITRTVAYRLANAISVASIITDKLRIIIGSAPIIIGDARVWGVKTPIAIDLMRTAIRDAATARDATRIITPIVYFYKNFRANYSLHLFCHFLAIANYKLCAANYNSQRINCNSCAKYCNWCCNYCISCDADCKLRFFNYKWSDASYCWQRINWGKLGNCEIMEGNNNII